MMAERHFSIVYCPQAINFPMPLLSETDKNENTLYLHGRSPK